jgi:hypothetical protein
MMGRLLMDKLREQLRRSERPIYYILKEEVGEALHLLVGMLELERKNISAKHYDVAQEQVKRVKAAVEETADMMQPPRDYGDIMEKVPDGMVRH